MDAIGGTVLNAHNGEELFNLGLPPPPCVPGAECNLETSGIVGCAEETKCFLMADAFIRISKHQIDLWGIPMGTHAVIPLTKDNTETSVIGMALRSPLLHTTKIRMKEILHLSL
jgi:hypothetical protein